MLVDQQVGNVSMALFHMLVLDEFQARDPKRNMDALMTAEYGRPISGLYQPAAGSSLPYYIAGTNDRTIIYIDGVQNQTQARAMIDGYTSSIDILIYGKSNSWALMQAQAIYRLIPRLSVQPENLDIVGYSGGGMVATLLRILFLNQALNPPKSKLVTFGAPRSTQARGVATLSRASIARWMTPNDGPSLLPFRIEDCPSLVLWLPRTTIVTWSNFVHSHGGIVINADGTFKPSDVPPDAAVDPVASVVSWLLSEENSPSNGHSKAAYIANLRAAQPPSPTIPPKVAEGGGGEDADVPHSREVNRRRSAVETAVQVQGRQQNETAPVVPDATLFKPIRIGRTWYVAFGDQIVITAPIEKRARHIARAGNDFLRSLPKQAVVDPSSLAKQLELFLALASSPDTGFSPQIRTTFPTE